MKHYDTQTPATRAADYFLTRYEGPTLEQYELVIAMFFRWCDADGIQPFGAHRTDFERYRHHLTDVRGVSIGTANNYLRTLRVFYKFAVVDDFITKSPIEHVRMPTPRFDDTRLVKLRRNQLGSLLRVAKDDGPTSHALVAMLALLGLRISEACNVHIEDYQGVEQGHRVLKIVGKGNVAATIPLPPIVLMAMEASADDRTEGPLMIRPTCGRPMNRKAAALILERLRLAAGIEHPVNPHLLRHAFITACLDSGADLRNVQKAARHADPRMVMRYDRARLGHDHHPNYGLAAFVSSAM